MKKATLPIAPMLLVMVLMLAGCGGASVTGGASSSGGGGTGSGTATVNGIDCSTHSQTITMVAESFDQFCYTVAINQPVIFDFPTGADTTGVVHIICSGVSSVCSNDPNAPKDLDSPGFTITPGEQHPVTFTVTGVYKVTCTLDPMTVQVVVK